MTPRNASWIHKNIILYRSHIFRCHAIPGSFISRFRT